MKIKTYGILLCSLVVSLSAVAQANGPVPISNSYEIHGGTERQVTLDYQILAPGDYALNCYVYPDEVKTLRVTNASGYNMSVLSHSGDEAIADGQTKQFRAEGVYLVDFGDIHIKKGEANKTFTIAVLDHPQLAYLYLDGCVAYPYEAASK